MKNSVELKFVTAFCRLKSLLKSFVKTRKTQFMISSFDTVQLVIQFTHIQLYIHIIYC